MGRVHEEPLPEFGIDLYAPALCETERKWVPLMLSKYRRCKFATWAEADAYLEDLKRTQPHLELKVSAL